MVKRRRRRVPELFDRKRSDRGKDSGMRSAAASRNEVLEKARDIAMGIAMLGDGTCNADDVGKRLYELFDIKTMGPAAGSLFKTEDWEFTGVWVKSTRASNHSRMIRVWRLV